MLPALLLCLLAQAAPSRPDIVVFVIDDVADSDIDVARTPTLHALAAQGVRFRRAYAHAWCAPSRDSLNYALRLGLDRGDACAPPVAETHALADFSLAKMFSGQGYHTLHVGKWHTGTNPIGDWKLTPELAGFDSVRNGVPIGPACTVSGSAQPRLDDGVFTITQEDNTIACRDAFLDWWNATPSPRFAVVNFGSAHAPFKYPPRSILPRGYPQCGLVCTNRQEYEAEIAGVDFVIGELLPQIGDPTYVMFLGDNGTPGLVPGEDPAVTVATRPDQDPARVKLTCYEDGVRVPLIVKGPGVAVGRESQALVQLYDVMPTLAQIAGIRLQLPLKGRAFGGALLGLPGRQTPVFVWNPPPRLDRAMIGPRWKLLTREDGVEELYDLQTDPHEHVPLPPVGPEADQLRALRAAVLAGG